MTEESTSLKQRLFSGIEAARANQYGVARKHFTAVLEEDSHNIPALLWLAFVSDSPHESLHLLEQVLALDPDNERANAGLRWVQGRLGPEPEAPAPVESSGESSGASATESLRQQLLADSDAQKYAKKGALAQRARRTINPFLAIILVTGALGLVAIGVSGLLFLPPDTLAAWLPTAAAPERLGPALRSPSGPSPVESQTRSQASTADTINLIDNLPVQTGAGVSAASPFQTEMGEPADGRLTTRGHIPAELSSVPPFLIGPRVSASEELEVMAAVDEALLAYQPAYPGEKWIEVNVTTQQVTAWEGNTPVMSFVASTGLPSTPTVLGEYQIYWKLDSTLMVGPNYYLPEVPYTMYFHGSYALHGTYWHSNFGQAMSHGCVNLTIEDSKKLFEWADPVIPDGQNQVVATADNPGTVVVVHK